VFKTEKFSVKPSWKQNMGARNSMPNRESGWTVGDRKHESGNSEGEIMADILN
jgi:hypothetical protein